MAFLNPPKQAVLAPARRGLAGRILRLLARTGLKLAAMVYLVLSVSFGAAGITAWMAEHRGGAALTSLSQMRLLTGVELGLGLLFLYFGLTSWMRAERPA